MLRFLFFIAGVFFIGTAFSQTANSYYEQGVTKMKNKDYEAAIAEFTKCIQKNEFFFEAYLERSKCYMIQKKNQEALKDLNQSLTVNPNYYEAFLQRAKVHLLLQQPKNALADFSEAIKLKPNEPRAYLERSDYYYSIKDFKEALKNLNQALLYNEENHEIYFKKAMIYIVQKNQKEALGELNKAISVKPDFQEALNQRIVLNYEIKEYQKVIEDAAKILKTGSESVNIFRMRAEALYFTGDFQNSISDLNLLLDKYQLKDPLLYYLRGNCYYKTDFLPEALKDFTRVSQLQPGNDSVNIAIARIHMKMNKPASALIYANKAISINSNNPESYKFRAEIFIAQKKLTLAINDLNASIKMKPDPESYYLRAICKEQAGDTKGACDDLNAAQILGHKKAKIEFGKFCK